MRWGLRPESDHLLHLDALRLIAATGIICLHYSAKIDWGSLSINPNNFFGLAMFVDLFFAISGFVIAFVYADRIRDIKSYVMFLRNRVARLGPLHWATLLLFSAFGIVAAVSGAAIDHKELYDPACFWPNILFLQGTPACNHLSYNMPAWSISAEFVMYVVTPVIVWASRKSWAILPFAIVAYIVVATERTGARWLDWTAPLGFARAFPSYCFGIAIFNARESLRLRFASSILTMAIVAFLVGVVLGVSDIALLLLLYAIFILAVCADRSGNHSRFIRILAAGGQLTYSSYMLHIAIMLVIVTVLAERVLHLHGQLLNAVVVLAFIVVWPISYLSLEFFERPLRKAFSAPRSPGQTDH